MNAMNQNGNENENEIRRAHSMTLNVNFSVSFFKSTNGKTLQKKKPPHSQSKSCQIFLVSLLYFYLLPHRARAVHGVFQTDFFFVPCIFAFGCCSALTTFHFLTSFFFLLKKNCIVFFSIDTFTIDFFFRRVPKRN